MFGVKVEETSSPFPAAPVLGSAVSSKKVFFGVEVDDPHALPLTGDEMEVTSQTSIAAKNQRVLLGILTVALGGLLALSFVENNKLSSARESLKTERAKSEDLQTKLDAAQAQATTQATKIKALEADKAKLTSDLAAKTAAYTELDAKLKAKSKASSHSAKKAKGRKGH